MFSVTLRLPSAMGGCLVMSRQIFSIAFFLLLYAVQGMAQVFGRQFIAVPGIDSSSVAWFTRTWIEQGRPLKAVLSVASTGRFDVFVNGYNVSRDALMPRREGCGGGALEMSFDVTRFARRDTNTVFIVCSPPTDMSGKAVVAACLYGLDCDGRRFSRPSDENWLCRRGDIVLAYGGCEWRDGRIDEVDRSGSLFDSACWVGAECLDDAPVGGLLVLPPVSRGERIVSILSPSGGENRGDSIVYSFDKTFRGFVRVTIRGARRGQKLSVDGSDYICTGQLDEQAFDRFSPRMRHRVVVKGGRRLRRLDIMKVEGLVLGGYDGGWFEDR